VDSWTKLKKFLGHVIFNESLNGPKIALNIMNEGQKKVEISSKNSPSNPSPSYVAIRA
jgi:hypothetical protein